MGRKINRSGCADADRQRLSGLKKMRLPPAR